MEIEIKLLLRDIKLKIEEIEKLEIEKREKKVLKRDYYKYIMNEEILECWIEKQLS